MRDRKPAARCLIEGCVKPVRARDWCQMHYDRWKRHGDVFAAVPPLLQRRQPGAECSESGCSRLARRRGLCASHHRAWLRTGPIDFAPPPTDEEIAARAEAERRYQREYKAAAYRRDPEAARASAKAWKAANPERMRQYYRLRMRRRRSAPRVPFTIDQLTGKIAYWGGLCWICRSVADAIDHVKPIGAGGWHALANLRPICTSCNSAKRDRWPFPTSPSAHRHQAAAAPA